MSDDCVTKELCNAQMAGRDAVLTSIAQDAHDAKEVGGKIMRRLFESGNDGPPLDVQITRNTDYRVKAEKDADARKRWRWARTSALIVGSTGGAVAVALWLADKYL